MIDIDNEIQSPEERQALEDMVNRFDLGINLEEELRPPAPAPPPANVVPGAPHQKRNRSPQDDLNGRKPSNKTYRANPNPNAEGNHRPYVSLGATPPHPTAVTPQPPAVTQQPPAVTPQHLPAVTPQDSAAVTPQHRPGLTPQHRPVVTLQLPLTPQHRPDDTLQHNPEEEGTAAGPIPTGDQEPGRLTDLFETDPQILDGGVFDVVQPQPNTSTPRSNMFLVHI